MPRDSFTLYDLRVTVEASERPMVCNHRAGDFFEVSGENLRLPPGQTFPLYPLAALLPLLPAKQRSTHPNDWMTHGRGGGLPRSPLWRPLPDRAGRAAGVPPRRGHGGSPASDREHPRRRR